ncbi:MAG: cobalt-precorrin-6A reductase [Pseudomonadota bacterium]
MPKRVLVLGGTREGRELAVELATWPGVDVTYSLAGRTRVPNLDGLSQSSIRIGGFGGVEGLIAYLQKYPVNAVVDATHPFATMISEHAVVATSAENTPYLRLERPAWTPTPNDDWRASQTIEDAVHVLAGMIDDGVRRVLLTIGIQDAHRFSPLAHPATLWVRSIEPPSNELAARGLRGLEGRPPFALDDELALFERLRLDAVVCKNSGGNATFAKIVAARELALPVVMIERVATEGDVYDMTSLADELRVLFQREND